MFGKAKEVIFFCKLGKEGFMKKTFFSRIQNSKKGRNFG